MDCLALSISPKGTSTRRFHDAASNTPFFDALTVEKYACLLAWRLKPSGVWRWTAPHCAIVKMRPRNNYFRAVASNIRIFEALTVESDGHLVREHLSLAGSGGGQPRIAHSRHGPWNQPLSRQHLEYIPLLLRTEEYLDQHSSARRTAKNRRFKLTPGCSNGTKKSRFFFTKSGEPVSNHLCLVVGPLVLVPARSRQWRSARCPTRRTDSERAALLLYCSEKHELASKLIRCIMFGHGKQVIAPRRETIVIAGHRLGFQNVDERRRLNSCRKKTGSTQAHDWALIYSGRRLGTREGDSSVNRLGEWSRYADAVDEVRTTPSLFITTKRRTGRRTKRPLTPLQTPTRAPATPLDHAQEARTIMSPPKTMLNDFTVPSAPPYC